MSMAHKVVLKDDGKADHKTILIATRKTRFGAAGDCSMTVRSSLIRFSGELLIH
jgi:hypothetical protein